MLGISNSAVGSADFHNILGACEFASDFTKILSEVEGFDNLINFIEDKDIVHKKQNIIELGKRIAELREAKMIVQRNKEAEQAFSKLSSKLSYMSMASLISVDSSSDMLSNLNSGASTAPTAASSSISGYGSEMSLSDDEYEEPVSKSVVIISNFLSTFLFSLTFCFYDYIS